MGNKVYLKCEEGCFDEIFNEGDSYCFLIIDEKNETIVGDIIGFANPEDIHIELINIKDEYQGKGYGTSAMEELINLGKEYKIKYIHGECRRGLIPFYKKFKADFSCRKEEDETYILERFYIDL